MRAADQGARLKIKESYKERLSGPWDNSGLIVSIRENWMTPGSSNAMRNVKLSYAPSQWTSTAALKHFGQMHVS